MEDDKGMEIEVESSPSFPSTGPGASALTNFKLFDQLHLLEFGDKYAIRAVGSPDHGFTIDRTDGNIEPLAGDDQLGKPAKTSTIYGVVGMIRLVGGVYMLVITSCKEVGSYLGFPIFRVQSMKFLSCNRALKQLSAQEKKDEAYFRNLLRVVESTPGLYYSYETDVTLNFQRRFKLAEDRMSKPIWKQADPRFVWNRNLLEDLIECKLHEFIVPLLQGSFQTTELKLKDLPATITLLSRRCTRRLGTRMWRRGANLEGDTANFIETEQLLEYKMYFCGPEANVSNRVLRKYPNDIDSFLRVSFVDEDLEKMYSTDLSPRASRGGRTELYRRVLSVLGNGILIDDKRFEFLAFSSSQLRENSLWMFASRPGLSASDIRRDMGTFSQIRNVAKYAARLGQSFGSSTETLNVYWYETEHVPDVEIGTGKSKYIFSDGIGKISADFARKVAAKCGIKGSTPSAFQIRYGGYKGVVAVDPASRFKLSLRKSMCKYQSEETKLDVLAYSKYQPCFLNRQLITLLSTLGVRDRAFEKKQREAISQLDAILTDPWKAQDALELMSPGENTNILKEMLGCGYRPDAEPYLKMMLQIFRSSKLMELRTKTRIFLPQARQMMGCLDETRTLEYGEVFVKMSSPRLSTSSNDFLSSDRYGSGSTRSTVVLRGNVAVAKNPCLHPGDVRVLRAVNVPSLQHMVDCVVFPQKGRRPHPNECSGSDLDGDIYFVCWDPELIPPRQREPMNYDAAENLIQDHDVTIAEVQEYFATYIVNDSLGIIANAHVAFADKEIQKAMSEPCLELAKLFSIAVDFPKTGVAAEIPPHLHVREYPDFMEKADKPTYESTNVIGKLFREVKERAPEMSSVTLFTRDVARISYDSDMEYEGFEDHLDDAFYFKSQYDYKLGNLMRYYGIKTEAEILSGNIMRMSRSFNKRKDADAIGVAVRSLRKEVRGWFNEKRNEAIDYGDDDCVYAKASAWYHVTYHPTYWGVYNEGMSRDHFISFPWCVYDRLIEIKKYNNQINRSRELSALAHRFGSGLGI